MSHYFDQAIQLIKDAFSEDIETKFQFNIPQPQSTDANYQEWAIIFDKSRIQFKEFLASLQDGIFEKLNASVLSGEYVEIDEFDKKIQEFLAALDAIPIPLLTPEYQEILTTELKAGFVDCLRFASDLYLDLFQQVKIRQSSEEKEYVSIPDFGRNKTGQNVYKNNNLVFFHNHLSVARLEHNMNPDIEAFQLLSQLRFLFLQDGEELKANKFSTLLIQKCSFLIQKLILRRETLLELGNSLTIISGNKVINLGAEIESMGNPLVEHWKDYIESHYDLDKRTGNEKIKSRCDQYRKKQLKDCTIKELHSLIKYYKDVKKSLSNLSEVRQEFERRWKDTHSLRTRNNGYSLSIAYHYALNNEFSLLLEVFPEKENEISSKYESIMNLQNYTGIKNFFPQFKYLHYLVGRFKFILDEKKALDAIKDSRQLIAKCEEVLKTYEKNIKWSLANYNYVFLLPFEESFVDVNHSVLKKVYLPSSFLLPLSKGRYREEFESLRRDFYSYTGSISVFENVERDIKDAQNKELRSMEVIGIFTAIVTFIATSIPAFKFIESPYQASVFMFALACSLGVFVLMIIISSRGIHKLSDHKRVVGWVVIGAIVGWMVLIYGMSDPRESKFVNEKRLQTYFDSIQNVNLNNKNLIYYDTIKVYDTTRVVSTNKKDTVKYKLNSD